MTSDLISWGVQVLKLFINLNDEEKCFFCKKKLTAASQQAQVYSNFS